MTGLLAPGLADCEVPGGLAGPLPEGLPAGELVGLTEGRVGLTFGVGTVRLGTDRLGTERLGTAGL